VRVVDSRPARASLRWIREAVNNATPILNQYIRDALQLEESTTVSWVSPLANDDYAEYRDQDFLSRVGIDTTKLALSEFWPIKGPQWDALGRTSEGKVLLVEAKANLPELVSPGTQARGERLTQIQNSLGKTKEFLGIDMSVDWGSTFYQYANRLAHLYFLRELNGIDAHLIFIYFMNDPDMKGPKTESGWSEALTIAKKALGLDRRHSLTNHISNIFIDVSTLDHKNSVDRVADKISPVPTGSVPNARSQSSGFYLDSIQSPIELNRVAHVRCSRTERLDDDWDSVVSVIELDASRFTADALLGLDQFSHIEVVFHFDRVAEPDLKEQARHPRGNVECPRVGVFAQRHSARPNRIGVTVCRLLKVEDTRLHVQGLDAIDGTPVLDIKPVMSGFQPRGAIREPQWAREIMAEYWKK